MKISQPNLKKIILQEAKKVLRESMRPEADFASAGDAMGHMSSYGEEGDDYADSEEEMDDFYSGIEKYDDEEAEYEDEYGDEDEYEEEDEYDDEEDEDEDY